MSTPNPFHAIKAGDRITRMLGGKVPMRLNVTGVTADRIVCFPWTFSRDTGMEIDLELGWDGVNTTGSQLRLDPVMDSDRATRTYEAAAKELFPDKPAGTYWCNSHQRVATSNYPDGRRCCDPKLGGILLPCFVVFAPMIVEAAP